EQQAPPVRPTATTVPATVSVGPNRDASSVLIPGLRSAVPRVGSGDDAALASEEEPGQVPTDRPAPAADPADTPLNPDARTQAGLLVQAGLVVFRGQTSAR